MINHRADFERIGGAKMEIDLRTELHDELCSKETDESRRRCESDLQRIFEQYKVFDEDRKVLLKALRGYIEGIATDNYDAGLNAGMELGRIKGYKVAQDDAKEMLCDAMLGTLLCMRLGVNMVMQCSTLRRCTRLCICTSVNKRR